jgi:hypothetical protein
MPDNIIILCDHVAAGREPDFVWVTTVQADGKLVTGFVKKAICSECYDDPEGFTWQGFVPASPACAHLVTMDPPIPDGFYMRHGSEWVLKTAPAVGSA